MQSILVMILVPGLYAYEPVEDCTAATIDAKVAEIVADGDWTNAAWETCWTGSIRPQPRPARAE